MICAVGNGGANGETCDPADDGCTRAADVIVGACLREWHGQNRRRGDGRQNAGADGTA